MKNDSFSVRRKKKQQLFSNHEGHGICQSKTTGQLQYVKQGSGISPADTSGGTTAKRPGPAVAVALASGVKDNVF